MASPPLTAGEPAPAARGARVGLAVLALAWLMGARGLLGGDPVAAAELVAWAEQASGGDLTHPAWIDAARELNRVRPWQAGFGDARERLGEIAAARGQIAGSGWATESTK